MLWPAGANLGVFLSAGDAQPKIPLCRFEGIIPVGTNVMMANATAPNAANRK